MNHALRDPRIGALAVALLSTVAWAGELKPTPDEFLIPRLAVTVDADLGEWDLDQIGYSIDPTQVGQDPAIEMLSSDPGNPIKGAADLSARVALAWDDTHLYLAAEVKDDDLWGIRPNTPHNVGPPGWKCDSVMLQIHSFRQPMKTNTPHTPSPNLNARYEVHPGGRGRLLDNSRRILDTADLYWKLTEGSTLATKETADGYLVEVAVPWADFEYKPQAGEILFACFLLGDIDEGEVLNQLGWNFSGEPKERPVFRLLGRPEATGVLSTAARTVEAGRKWSVSYRVDARTADAKVQRLVLVGPEGEAASLPLDVAVPKGQTATDVVVIDKAPAEAGAYQARLVVDIGGKSDTLAAESFEVLPAAPPAPRIRNAPGELHHQRPDRVAHHAYDDHRRNIIRHGFVTDRSGYEKYILTHVKDALEGNVGMEFYLDRESENVVYRILECYVLHKLTGDEKYADWTRRGIDVALKTQAKKLEHMHMLTLSEVRYFVWQHDPKTPLAPPAAEQRFQEIWANHAADHDPAWMYAEYGYHNRCYHRWVALKCAKLFAEKLGKPIDPRVDGYLDWHQPIIDHFGYTTDNSSGYHWVGFRYPYYWHLVDDSIDELGRHPGWQAALSRWRRYSSPSGAVPNFGDTSGWMSGAGQAMVYYELFGKLTGDGRFRWQAHRIAEYFYNHFWPRHNQYHLPKDRTAEAFCRAWLWADDTVEPKQPEQQSAVTFRTRCVEPTDEDKQNWPGRAALKLTDEQVPDKLVLTSGNDGSRLWALVELIDKGGHCGEIPGHIVTLMQHDTVLLATAGYNEESPDVSNLLWVEDLEGVAADPRPMRCEVTKFVEDPAVTYARLRMKHFQQLPVTYERDLVFVKNGFMLVKDRVTFEATMKVRVGPCWQTRDLGPQCGDDWFNTYYEWVYHTGLGLGRGVHAYRNPAWDLLIRFAPRDDTQITVTDRYDGNPWRPSPTRLRQAWSGIAQPGLTKTFTTVLLPHGPDHDVTPYADWIEFLRDDDNATLVRVKTEFDNLNHLGETHYVLLQEGVEAIEAGGFSSDGAFALVTLDRNGKVRPGVVVEGTGLELEGNDLFGQARKPEVQVVYEVNE